MDIGGTKTTGALFSEDGKLVDNYTKVKKSQTFKGEEAVYQNTKKVLEEIIKHFNITMEEIIGIGVGSPGPLDTKAGVIIHAPLMKWKNFPIVERLEADFHKPVKLDNDGNLGALAEQRCGVARGFDNIMYMTVSTGCGSGILLNGQIYHGKNDGAGEVGHISIDPDGFECPCGSRGCFELYASGTAINDRVRQDVQNGVKTTIYDMADGDAQKIDGALILKAAESGDAYALEVYKQEGYYLGVGISNLFNLVDPDVIVLGGGVTKAKKYFHDELMRTLKARCIQKIEEEQVKYSVMNDKVVLHGAYYLIRDFIEQKAGN